MTKSIINEIEKFSNFKAVLDSLDEIIGIIDTEYNVVFENKKAVEIYGNKLGKKCYKSYGKKEKICQNCPTEKVFKTKKNLFQNKYHMT